MLFNSELFLEKIDKGDVKIEETKDQDKEVVKDDKIRGIDEIKEIEEIEMMIIEEVKLSVIDKVN